MRGVGEHVDGLHADNAVVGIHELQVAGLCGRIAADVDYALGSGFEYNINHIRMHTGAGRIGYYDIGPAVLCDELLQNQGPQPQEKEETLSQINKGQTNGSLAHITAIFGFTLAGLVLQDAVENTAE